MFEAVWDIQNIPTRGEYIPKAASVIQAGHDGVLQQTPG